MEKLQDIELTIKDEQEDGVFAVSLVEKPAIEKDFIALSKEEIKLKVIDEDKRIVVGFALVPDKKIYRRIKDKEFNVFFSKDTVRQVSELYMKNLNLNKFTVEHEKNVTGVNVIESWIVEDPKNDKSNLYNLDPKGGEWVMMSKIYNDDVWNDIKNGDYKGYSIEGKFDGLQALEMSEEVELESYNDYPKEASNNAKTALRYAEENGWGSCGTAVGKQRANQLAKGEAISEETISRMASFARHKQNSEKELGDGCGRLMWLAWGGDAGINWASRKLEQIKKEKTKLSEDSEREETIEAIKDFLKSI